MWLEVSICWSQESFHLNCLKGISLYWSEGSRSVILSVLTFASQYIVKGLSFAF